jgi:hypothetical protein
VLKGDQKLSQIVINQVGGRLANARTMNGNARLVQPGEHYIVFLVRVLPNGMAALPQRDLPRFSAMGAGGWFTVEQTGIVRVNTVLPFAKEYDGKTLSRIISEIEMAIADGSPAR